MSDFTPQTLVPTVVVVHPRRGVLLGLGRYTDGTPRLSWSREDPGLSDRALAYRASEPIPFMETVPETLRRELSTVVVGLCPQDAPVRGATMVECVKAGLPAWAEGGDRCEWMFRDRATRETFTGFGATLAEGKAAAEAAAFARKKLRSGIDGGNWDLLDVVPLSAAQRSREKREVERRAAREVVAAAVAPAFDRVIITHPTRGVYLGTSEDGAQHWTKHDFNGAVLAPTFVSPEAASAAVANLPVSARFAEIRREDASVEVATVTDCIHAGLEPWTHDGREMLCHFVDTRGRCQSGFGKTLADALASAARSHEFFDRTGPRGTYGWMFHSMTEVTDDYLQRQAVYRQQAAAKAREQADLQAHNAGVMAAIAGTVSPAALCEVVSELDEPSSEEVPR